MAEFTHLHLHTDYSLLDGACDVDKLVERVASIGQKSVAMTDHGNIYGAVHFFDAAKKKGIKPILGCELYVCKKEDHRADPSGDKYNHLLVLAESEEGYRNLIRINIFSKVIMLVLAHLRFSTRTSSAKAISIWRFRIRASNRKSAFMPICSSSSVSWIFPW